MATPSFMEHWLEVNPERLERYETMFQWNPATAHYYEAAKLGPGQVVADFGCGPGHAAIEFAKRVGPGGHVYALDINDEFIRRARARAEANGFGDRITAHLLTDERLPLPDAVLDRVIARNTVIYVPDPLVTLTEFRRVLRRGGLAHAIEGDWYLTAIEPVPNAVWQALIEAASWAWPQPDIGRRLHAIARQAGFDEVSVQVLTQPDTEGRLRGMIETVTGYALEGGKLPAQRIEAVRQTVDRAMAEGTYLAVVPQFIVTARVAA